MKLIRTLLAGLVLAGGLLSGGAVASAAPGDHGKQDRAEPVPGKSAEGLAQRSITWE